MDGAKKNRFSAAVNVTYAWNLIRGCQRSAARVQERL